MILYKNNVSQITNPYVDTLFLWKDDVENIFLMDNHRCALWRWEQVAKQQIFSNYFLIHIDQHDDLAMPNPNAPTAIGQLTINDYLDSKVSGFYDFQWDNYILQYKKIHQNLKYRMYYGSNFKNYSGLSLDLNQLRINAQSDFLVINLDMDLFFTKTSKKLKTNGLNHMYLVCYECLKLYRKYRSNAVFTIALSPTCCGKEKDLTDVVSVIKIIEEVLRVDINKDVIFWDFLH